MTSNVNTLWVDPVIVRHLLKQGVNSLCIRSDLARGTLR
jgi:hypothetical protein